VKAAQAFVPLPPEKSGGACGVTKLLRKQEMCESTRSVGDVAIRRLISESGYWQQAETRGSIPSCSQMISSSYAAYSVRGWGSIREAAGRGFAARRLLKPQTHETPPPQSTPTKPTPTPPSAHFVRRSYCASAFARLCSCARRLGGTGDEISGKLAAARVAPRRATTTQVKVWQWLATLRI
jgi:hypothetical protein